jgi:hypothetical protein
MACTSVDIDVLNDVNNCQHKATKVLITSRCLSSIPQYNVVYIQKHCDFTEFLYGYKL